MVPVVVLLTQGTLFLPANIFRLLLSVKKKVYLELRDIAMKINKPLFHLTMCPHDQKKLHWTKLLSASNHSIDIKRANFCNVLFYYFIFLVNWALGPISLSSSSEAQFVNLKLDQLRLC